MKRFIFDVRDGEIISQVSEEYVCGENEGSIVVSDNVDVCLDSHYIKDGAVSDKNSSQWAEIEKWRDIHEVAHIETSFGLFHADPNSVELRMKGAIEQFDYLPTVDAEGKLQWKCPNATYKYLTRDDLAEIYREIKVNTAIRSAVLHRRAIELRKSGMELTPAQLADLSFWLEE